MAVDEELPEIAGFVDLAVIGRGGTATVYSATQTSMHRQVAIKVVEATGAQARRFEREVLALGKMDGIPHVVTVHSVELTTDGRPALVMPLLPRSLGAIVRDGGCPVDDVLAWAKQLAVAIDEAHRREIWHRDIKPENVLISSFGDAYLADFGIATLADMTAATMTAMSLSPPYAPPERYTGGAEVPAAGDVYSFAATLYAALAGRPPFGTTAEGGLQGLASRITGSPPPPIPGVERAVSAVLEQGLAKSPDQRPPTAGELVAALEAAVSRSPGATAPPPPQPSPPPPSSSARPGGRTDDPTVAFTATQAYPADAPPQRAGRGVDLTAGLLLTPAEARSGGIHPVRAIGPSSFARNHPEVPVRVPPGVRQGQRLRVEGKGGVGAGDGEPGDLYVVVHVAGESPFTRRDNDLCITVPVSAVALQGGTQLEVTTIHGDRAAVEVPPRTESGATFRVPNGGSTFRFGRGDLVVTVVALDDRPRPAVPPPPSAPRRQPTSGGAPRPARPPRLRMSRRKRIALAVLVVTSAIVYPAAIMKSEHWGPFAPAAKASQSSTTTTAAAALATPRAVRQILSSHAYACDMVDGFIDLSSSEAAALLEAYRARELAAGHETSTIAAELAVVEGADDANAKLGSGGTGATIFRFSMYGCTKDGSGAPVARLWSMGLDDGSPDIAAVVVVEPKNPAAAELQKAGVPVITDPVLGRRP